VTAFSAHNFSKGFRFMDEKQSVPLDMHPHGAKLVRWFRAAALAFFLPPTLLLGISVIAANNVERFRDRVQDCLEFQSLLEPSLNPDHIKTLVEELRQEGVWREVREVSPMSHFRNIQGLDDWMSDDVNRDIVAAMSTSLRLKPREVLRQPDAALQAAQALRGRSEVREVYTDENTVKSLYLNFEFWKNTAVLMEWISGAFCLLIAWLLRNIKHKILTLHPVDHKSHRASRAIWFRLALGIQKSLVFGATPLICLIGIYVTLDYTAAPIFHALLPTDPLFPLRFLPAAQACGFWLFGTMLWWIISNPMAYKAEKS
jgi:hypothetical protein